jgi:hypothetical protein
VDEGDHEGQVPFVRQRLRSHARFVIRRDRDDCPRLAREGSESIRLNGQQSVEGLVCERGRVVQTFPHFEPPRHSKIA